VHPISIGIPVYNQAATIADAIESVLAQNEKPREIVVSENHSTDGTREIVERYRDRVRIVRPPEHIGMAANWNFCVRACEGEWVGLCSGDDRLLPNYVKSFQMATALDPSAVFVMGGWEIADEVNGTVELHHLLSMGTITRPPRTLGMLLRGPKASFAAFSFRRTTFESIGGYDPAFHLNQDWMFQFEAAKHGSFIKVDELVARYRIRNRPDLAQRRVPLYLQDMTLYLSERIWQATAHGVASAEVNRAARAVWRHILRYIRVQGAELDANCEVRLREVARRLGEENAWRRWQSGTWTPGDPGAFQRWFRHRLRNVYTLVRHGRPTQSRL